MKEGLTFSFILLVTISSLGQIEMPEYDFDKLKGVDSIAVYITSDSNSWKEVYYYQAARRIKANYFDKGSLSYYRLFRHDQKKQLWFESYFGKTSEFDPDKSDWIEFWDPSSCHLTIKRYSGVKLVEQMNGEVDEPDTTINHITAYTYDTKQRIVSEVTRDVFKGLVGSFKSNSVDLKGLGEKRDTIVYHKTYKYGIGKVEVFYKVNETLTGKETIGLDGKGRVSFINQYSDKNILLSETTALYDENGKLKSKTWKTYSSTTVWGQETDVEMDGTETIEYDRSGRPTIKLTAYTGSNKTKTEYRYY